MTSDAEIIGTGTNTPRPSRVGRFMGRVRRAREKLNPTVGVMWNAAEEAQKSQLPQMAAALAYRTIFSLIPMIVIALVVIKAYTTEEEMRAAVRRAMEYTGITKIAIHEPPAEFVGPPAPGANAVPAEPDPLPSEEIFGPPRPDPETPEAAPSANADELPPEAQPVEPEAKEVVAQPDSIDDWIETLVDRVSGISFKTIGVIGVAALIYAALSMLVEVERAFNQIYRVPSGRSWTRRIMLYWTLLTLGTGALAGTFYLGAQFTTWVNAKAAEQGLVNSGGLHIGAVGFFITVIISTGLFLLMYLAVPNTRVKVLPAIAGAFTGAVMWEAGKWGFTQYLERSGSSSYGKLYGAIALIPLFLIWVYVSWWIVLFGLQVAYYIQHGRLRTRAQPLIEQPPTVIDPAAAVSVIASVARGFSSGQTVTCPEVVKSTRLHEGLVCVVLGKLGERGLLHRIDRGGAADEEPAYSLARPPSSIRIADILSLGYDMARTTRTGEDSQASSPEDPIAERLRKAQIEAAGDQRLEDILPHDEPAPTAGAAKPEAREHPEPGGNGYHARNGSPAPARTGPTVASDGGKGAPNRAERP